MRLRDRRTKLRIASIAVGVTLILLALFSHFAIGSSGRVVVTQEEGVDSPIFSGDYLLFVKAKDTGARESDGVQQIRISEPEKLLTKKVSSGISRDIEYQDAEDISLFKYGFMQQIQAYVSFDNGRVAMGSHLFDLANATASSAPWDGIPFAKVGNEIVVRNNDEIQFWNLASLNISRTVIPPQDVQTFMVNETEAVGRTGSEIVRFDLEGLEFDRIDIPAVFQDGVIRPFSNGWLLIATEPGAAVGLMSQNGTMQWQEDLNIPELTSIVAVASNEQQFAVLWYQQVTLFGRDSVTPSIGLAYGDIMSVQGKIEFDVNAVSKGRLSSVAVHDGDVYYTDWLKIYKLAPGKELIPWIPTAGVGAVMVAGGLATRLLDNRQSSLPRSNDARCSECGAKQEFSFCQRCGFQEP